MKKNEPSLLTKTRETLGIKVSELDRALKANGDLRKREQELEALASTQKDVLAARDFTVRDLQALVRGLRNSNTGLIWALWLAQEACRKLEKELCKKGGWHG